MSKTNSILTFADHKEQTAKDCEAVSEDNDVIEDPDAEDLARADKPGRNLPVLCRWRGVTARVVVAEGH